MKVSQACLKIRRGQLIHKFVDNTLPDHRLEIQFRTSLNRTRLDLHCPERSSASHYDLLHRVRNWNPDRGNDVPKRNQGES
jgi:hypothetical protein